MKISDWLPPVVKKSYRAIVPSVRVYPSLAAAEKAVAHVSDYNNDLVTDIVLEKTKRYAAQLTLKPTMPEHHLFLIAALSQCITQSSLRVLDFGGAFGTHYFIAKTYFPHIQFDWQVVELPKVIQKGKVLENGELQFRDINGALTDKIGDYDLVMTSATLQHMPDPEQALQFLLLQQAPKLLLMRLDLNATAHHQWIIHNARYQDCGPGPALPHLGDGMMALPFCMLSAARLDQCMQDYNPHLTGKEVSGMSCVHPAFTGFNRLYTRK